jgi:hypothetical protein
MDYLSTLLGNNVSVQTLHALVDHNRLASYLRPLGYDYVLITSSGFRLFNGETADLAIQEAQGASSFRDLMLLKTPLAPLAGGAWEKYQMHRESLHRAFNALSDQAGRGAKPRFYFVHILAPHPPFVFNADGSAHATAGMYSMFDWIWFTGTEPQFREGYSQQGQYISKLMLSAIDNILSKSTTPPIIVVAGDHGSRVEMPADDLAHTNVPEIVSNLAAFYVPEATKAKLYPTITPVNYFRIIFNGLFGDKFPILPDREYYTSDTYLRDFTDMSSLVRAADAALSAGKSPPINPVVAKNSG